jgi:hypothetical protein
MEIQRQIHVRAVNRIARVVLQEMLTDARIASQTISSTQLLLMISISNYQLEQIQAHVLYAH